MKRISMPYLLYLIFERTRRGKWALFPLGLYKKFAVIVNTWYFREAINQSAEKYLIVRDDCSTNSLYKLSDGWCLIKNGEHAELKQALASCQEYIKDRANQNDERLNPYSIASRKELLADERIKRFLESPAIMNAAAEYLGAYPSIAGVDLLESRPRSGELAGSQNYHLDNIAERAVRLVLHVSDVNYDQGPFTFFPEAASNKICKSVKYNWRLDYAEVPATEVEAAVDDCKIEAIGNAGTVLLVDTCRCIHYGSRVNTGLRHVLMATYMVPPYTNFRWAVGLQ